MSAIAVNVQFDIGNAGLKHGGEIFIGPDRVHAIAGAAASDEGRRGVARNGGSCAAGEGRGARIDQRDEVRTGTNARERTFVVLLIEFVEEKRRRGGEFGPGGASD